MNASLAEGCPKRVADGPEQSAPFWRGQAAYGPCGVDTGTPEDFVGEQVADAGDPLLVHDPYLDRRCATCRQCGPELRRRDQQGIGSQLFDGRVQPDAA
jgi:hypothetical protein